MLNVLKKIFSSKLLANSVLLTPGCKLTDLASILIKNVNYFIIMNKNFTDVYNKIEKKNKLKYLLIVSYKKIKKNNTKIFLN